MAGIPAGLPAGVRLSDPISLGVIARAVPPERVREVLADGWIKRGVTRELKSNHGRVNVNVNGALSWPDREVAHRQAAKITSAAMIELLDALAARHPSASAIQVVLDNASYHRSAAIKGCVAADGCRIKLVYLPAYSPNLNLIERL